MRFITRSTYRRVVLTLGTSALLCGCAGPDTLPRGNGMAAFPAIDAAQPIMPYRLGPLDSVSVTVFEEPDLSLQNVQINAAGILSLPLLGETRVAGFTTDELAARIRAELFRTYLKNPQVSVAVTSSVSQQVTVEGNVTQPGVYSISGQTTLLKALALARSPNKLAETERIVIFRNVEGQRMGAIFRLSDIRTGRSPDPVILGNDVVVVGFSALKGAYRDFLSIAPALSIFAAF